jgi:predicted nucleotidyltransferase
MVRKSEHMFEKVNLSSLAISVLAYLARSPDNRYYVREIATNTGGSVGGCYKALKKLYDMDLVKKEKSGRNLYFNINNENPAIKYFKIFINIQEVNDTIKSITRKCNKIILYGSCSTGEDTIRSDIDLLIITENVEEIKQTIKNTFIGKRQLKPIIMLPHEFIKLKDKDRAFYNEINKGITLWRGSNE